jgi:hypothetical protein
MTAVPASRARTPPARAARCGGALRRFGVGGACSGAGGGVAAGPDEWSPGPGMEGAREARLQQVASLRAALRPGPSRRRVSHVRGRRRPQELAALKRGMDVVMASLGGARVSTPGPAHARRRALALTQHHPQAPSRRTSGARGP